jgi:hypothetical protein
VKNIVVSSSKACVRLRSNVSRDLPDVITVDVSALVGDGIHVRDIVLPAGVTTRIPPDLTVYFAPTVEEEPVAAAEV